MKRLILLAVMAVFPLAALATVQGVGIQNCSADASVSPVEAQFVALLNTYRAQNGAGPLTVSPTLSRAAQWMANDLAAHNAFSHTDSLGRSFQTRIVQCGATGFVGENVAGGGTSAAFTLANWQSSAGHNAAMLNPNFKQIGIAYALGGPYGSTWVADFGSQQADPLPPNCYPAPELGPDAIACDGGPGPDWQRIYEVTVQSISRE